MVTAGAGGDTIFGRRKHSAQPYMSIVLDIDSYGPRIIHHEGGFTCQRSCFFNFRQGIGFEP